MKDKNMMMNKRSIYLLEIMILIKVEIRTINIFKPSNCKPSTLLILIESIRNKYDNEKNMLLQNLKHDLKVILGV